MKKHLCLLGISIAFLFSSIHAQTIVSTSPEKSNVVLEEFTGIYCTYCPDGHVIAQGIKDNNPGDVVLVNVHVGGYADPDPGDPDFRTAFGTALANQSDLCGYPAGTVNRVEFPGLEQTNSNPPCTATTAMGRGNWSNAAGQILPDDSPVNVAATCTLDVLTNVMTFYVEAYYTGNSNTATNKLTIAVSENGIKGPQTGAVSFNPGNIDADGNYSHNHVLRAFVTGQWGEEVTPTTSGSLYSGTFTYTIPSDYVNIVPNIGNFEAAVYIAEGQENILTGAMVPIVYANIPTSNNAAVASVRNLGAVCGTEVSPTVTIKNLGGNNLTSLDITYDINGGGSITHNWTGDLSYAVTEDVILPSINFTAQGTNTVNVTFSNPNGNVDEDPADDSDNSTFDDAPLATSAVELTLLLDDYCAETSWELKNSAGTTIASGGPYDCSGNGGGAQAGATITQVFNLGADDCYSFDIFDSYGDGLNGAAFGGTNGSYTLISNSNVIGSGGGSVQFTEEANPFEFVCATATLAFSATEPSCGQNDGSVSCTVTGTGGPYTYLWSNGQSNTSISGLSSGIYALTITDQAGCETAETIIVSNSGAATVTSQSTPVSCFGDATGEIDLTITGGTTPYSFAWNNGASADGLTGLTVGDYTVTLTDAGGCVTFETASITGPDAMVVTSTITGSTGGDGAITLSLAGGTPSYQYSWDNGATTQSISNLASGIYFVTITDGLACEYMESFTVPVVGTISIQVLAEEPVQITVYPNPFSHAAIIEFALLEQEHVSIDVMNLVGELVYTQHHGTLDGGTHKLKIAGDHLVPGVYFMQIQIGETLITKKIVRH